MYSAKCANILGTAVARAVAKGAADSVCNMLLLLKLQRKQKEQDYKKKQYWINPYLKDHQEHSFFHVSILKLTFENGIRFLTFFHAP